MKLPDLQYGSVEKTPQATPVVPGQLDTLSSKLAVTTALSNLAATGALAAQHISDERATYQAQQASFTLENTMQTWEQKNRKPFYTSAELPADVKVRRTDKIVMDNGEIAEVERQNIPAYEVYPQLFEKQMNSTIEASAYGIDRPDVRQRWTQIHTVEGQKHLTAAVVAATNAQQGAIRTATIEHIDQAAQAGNRQAVVALADQFPGTEEEKTKVLRGGLHKLEVSQVQNAIATGNLSEMESQIIRLSNPDEASNLSGPEREAAVRELKMRSMEYVTSKAYAEQLKKDYVYLGLWKQAQLGKLDELDVRKAREAGIVTVEKMTELLKANMEAVEKTTKTKVTYTEISRLQMTRPGVSVVVGNEDNQKAVDDGYTQATAGADAQTKFDTALGMARMYSYLPKPYRTELQSADRSMNPDQLFAAATQYREIQRWTPAALRDMKDEDTQNIRRVLAVMDLGGPNAEINAKEYATRLTKMTAADKEAEKNRGEMVNKYIENRAPEVITDYFQKRGDFGARFIPFTGMSRPSTETLAEMKKAGKVPLEIHTGLPAQGQAEFEVMFRQELVNSGGDPTVAERMALDRWSNAWRPTEVNGFGQFMRDLPRGVDDKVLREFIDLAYPDKKGEVFIMSDKRTQLAVDARTTSVPYQLYRIDPETKAPMHVATLNYEPKTFTAKLNEMRVDLAKRQADFGTKVKAEVEREISNLGLTELQAGAMRGVAESAKNVQK